MTQYVLKNSQIINIWKAESTPSTRPCAKHEVHVYNQYARTPRNQRLLDVA